MSFKEHICSSPIWDMTETTRFVPSANPSLFWVRSASSGRFQTNLGTSVINQTDSQNQLQIYRPTDNWYGSHGEHHNCAMKEQIFKLFHWRYQWKPSDTWHVHAFMYFFEVETSTALHSLPLMTMWPFLQMVPACWGQVLNAPASAAATYGCAWGVERKRNSWDWDSWGLGEFWLVQTPTL